ncbi:YIP1 family protein [Aldersonia sp. NBC_00410]|uniref:Yip1 family protein n=1 Tax=Aldersonia sp. NBC_00410 TaxID=2975954 RepID=UPI002253C6EA|nr:Yip1 family protein [Aldersonia sp. NBC_00410]MCX5041791.1 YIP1 family protein [Aldersonia sp. NBC_00410]
MSTAEESPTDTGQISVAELLARNGRTGTGTSSGAGGGGRRRRGESGGGISVTELTGELPKVRATTSHRRAVLDPDEADETPAEAVSAPPDPTPAAAPEPVETQHEDDTTSHAWSALEREPELLSGGSVASELLRNSIEATRDKPDKPEPESEAPEPQVAKAPDAAQEFPIVDVPTWAITGEVDVRDDLAEKDTAEKDTAEKGTAEKGAIDRPKQAEPTTQVSAGTAESTDDTDPETDEATDSTEADAEPDEHSERDSIKQWLALAGEAAVALIVGGLLFKGFERLWDMMPWVALVLSVLVILGLVALVRVVRKTDDILSFVIAIVVGIFITIGPLAFLLSTG